MNSHTEDISTLQAQLADKNDLVAALTAQLEKTAKQMDRLIRNGAERGGHGAAPASAAVSGELTGKLVSALDEWQEFQPAERIERIETGIDRILDLLKAQQSTLQLAAQPQSQKPASNQDFWAAAKARILGDEPSPPVAAEMEAEHGSAVVAEDQGLEANDAIFNEIGAAPEIPTPITDASDPDELLTGMKTRDAYIQYLTARLRLAESRKYLPVKWELLAAAPENFRGRLESLETLLKDHLRQAEISLSLERALLARERAKLSQIKQNLETQIKKMVSPVATPANTPTTIMPAIPTPVETKAEQEGRWKRIFSR